MRTLVHLSDIHFGSIDYSTVGPLLEVVAGTKPDLVAVSGDLTQRARAGQFREARAFLDALPSPQIVVPGNHDIPLYNVFGRFFKPLSGYRRYISSDLQPFYLDEEIAVLGLNTARSLTIKEGRLNEEQAALARERLCGLDDGITRVVVTHHPFDLPEGHGGNLVGRSRMVMEVLASCGVDVLLSGHLHIGLTTSTARRYRIAGHSAIVVQAGTATSSRGRGETNSFNVLRVERPDITIERLSWRPEQRTFAVSVRERFRRTPEGWAAEQKA